MNKIFMNNSKIELVINDITQKNFLIMRILIRKGY